MGVGESNILALKTTIRKDILLPCPFRTHQWVWKRRDNWAFFFSRVPTPDREMV